jgi:hypothetical protein
MEYDRRHQAVTVHSFWQYIHFTDEAHFDPGESYSKRVLREEGTRYEPQNMQPMPDMKGVKLHFAASISWHHKSPLLFYNDEHDPPPVSPKSPASHENRDTRRRINTISVYSNERHHCHTILRSSLRETRWLRSIIQNDCCLCTSTRLMRHEFFMIEWASYRRTTTTVTTLDRKITLLYASKQSTESTRYHILRSRPIWTRQKVYGIY